MRKLAINALPLYGSRGVYLITHGNIQKMHTYFLQKPIREESYIQAHAVQVHHKRACGFLSAKCVAQTLLREHCRWRASSTRGSGCMTTELFGRACIVLLSMMYLPLARS